MENFDLAEMLAKTNIVLMLEAMRRGFVLTPEEMKQVRDLEDTCHKLSQADDLRNINDVMETMVKAMEGES